jgi:hypothetical protein
METTAAAIATIKRHRAPSGDRDSDRFQAVCAGCDWASLAFHSNRTVEGHRLAQRDVDDHNSARHAS